MSEELLKEELFLLREFYKAWHFFHHEAKTRLQKEQAAQYLVDAAHAIEHNQKAQPLRIKPLTLAIKNA